MKKLKKILVTVVNGFKIAKAYSSADDLMADKKFKEALTEIEKVKNIAYGKSPSYHFYLGRGHWYANNDFLEAIKEFQCGLTLLEEKKIGLDEKEYFFAWAKYSIGLCLYDMGKNEEAEEWRDESEKHYFDFKKVPKSIRDSFPMPWHVDCGI